MYKLKARTNNGVRIGQYTSNGKTVSTPAYFFISNVGGGGTNVSRIFTYFDLFSSGQSQLLLNYYYLNTHFKKRFDCDRDTLSKLEDFEDILDFMGFARDNFQNRGLVSPEYTQPTTAYNPLVMLDSGSGDIFRDLILSGKVNSANFEQVCESEVLRYEEFAAGHRFDFSIAMDIAEKYTKKQGEHANKAYKSFLKRFLTDEVNLGLLRKTLQLTPKNKGYASYAPVHGNNEASYSNFISKIIEVEHKNGKRFDGFAIGGLGKIRSRPELYKIIKAVRKVLVENDDNRPLHILGVGALQNIIPMSILGADSFDCHSPWRRASEGKYTVPLFNASSEVLPNNEFWDYKPLSSIDVRTYGCDCPVCSEFDIPKLKKIYGNGGEDQYFAKVLLFKHNIFQQEKTCEVCREDDLEDVVSNFPATRDKQNLIEAMDLS
jgi:hypothetical protein